MEVAKEESAEAPAVEPKLNRQQKRMLERANEQANEMHRRLVNQFCEFFIDNDPASDGVTEKQKEVNAKWRMYCKNKNLTPEVFDIVDKSCKEFREQFNNELNETALPS